MKRRTLYQFIFILLSVAILSSCDFLTVDTDNTVTYSTTEYSYELESPQITYNTYYRSFQWNNISGCSYYEIYVDNTLYTTTNSNEIAIDFDDYGFSHIVGIRAIPFDSDYHGPSLMKSMIYITQKYSSNVVQVGKEDERALYPDSYGNYLYSFHSLGESDYEIIFNIISEDAPAINKIELLSQDSFSLPIVLDDQGSIIVHLERDQDYWIVVRDVIDSSIASIQIKCILSLVNQDQISMDLESRASVLIDLGNLESGMSCFVSDATSLPKMEIQTTFGGWFINDYGYACIYINPNYNDGSQYFLSVSNSTQEDHHIVIYHLNMDSRAVTLENSYHIDNPNRLEIYYMPSDLYSSFDLTPTYFKLEFNDEPYSVTFRYYSHYDSLPLGITQAWNNKALYQVVLNRSSIILLVIKPVPLTYIGDTMDTSADLTISKTKPV